MILQRQYESFDDTTNLKELKQKLDDEINNIITILNDYFDNPSDIINGSGSPEGSVIANPGKLYINLDGGSPTFYVKESGTSTTGWVGK